jgi:hypothetical protein
MSIGSLSTPAKSLAVRHARDARRHGLWAAKCRYSFTPTRTGSRQVKTFSGTCCRLAPPFLSLFWSVQGQLGNTRAACKHTKFAHLMCTGGSARCGPHTNAVTAAATPAVLPTPHITRHVTACEVCLLRQWSFFKPARVTDWPDKARTLSPTA